MKTALRSCQPTIETNGTAAVINALTPCASWKLNKLNTPAAINTHILDSVTAVLDDNNSDNINNDNNHDNINNNMAATNIIIIIIIIIIITMFFYKGHLKTKELVWPTSEPKPGAEHKRN